MTPLVRLERVSKSYVEGDVTRAVLLEVTTSMDQGEFVAIRGRSGSGKSTLLNLVAGIDSPTKGEVFFEEQRVSGMSQRASTLLRRGAMGFVFQSFNLIPTLTALENVILPAELNGARSVDARDRAMGLLDRVGLGDRRDSFPEHLSGGEQQRVAIARALVHGPRLVLADEPTGNLDARTGDSVLDLLEAETLRSGGGLLLVTHSSQLAARAHREMTIEDGRLVSPES